MTSPVVKVVNDHQYMVYLLCRAVSVRRYHDICTFRVACQCDDHPATMCADHETDTSAQVMPLNVRTSNQKCNLANVQCSLLSNACSAIGSEMLVLRASTTHLHCLPPDCQTRSWPDALILSTQLRFTLYHESFQLVLLLFTTTTISPFTTLTSTGRV